MEQMYLPEGFVSITLPLSKVFESFSQNQILAPLHSEKMTHVHLQTGYPFHTTFRKSCEKTYSDLASPFPKVEFGYTFLKGIGGKSSILYPNKHYSLYSICKISE